MMMSSFDQEMQGTEVMVIVVEIVILLKSYDLLTYIRS
jgi:hypothetical protein